MKHIEVPYDVWQQIVETILSGNPEGLVPSLMVKVSVGGYPTASFVLVGQKAPPPKSRCTCDLAILLARGCCCGGK